MIHVLLVEDDNAIIDNLTEFLRSEGFEVEAVTGQNEAIAHIEQKQYDLILLDVSLSDGNGFAVCTAIRGRSDIPVVFLTASCDEYSVVAGLDMGADDYISKPFRPRELVSRLRTVLRRRGKSQAVIELGRIKVDTDKASVTKAGTELFLSALEYRLLLSFINNRGQVLTRSKLLEDIWDVAGDFVNDNTLTVYIKRLRDKIEENPQEPELIKTVRGLGYRLD